MFHVDSHTFHKLPCMIHVYQHVQAVLLFRAFGIICDIIFFIFQAEREK